MESKFRTNDFEIMNLRNICKATDKAVLQAKMAFDQSLEANKCAVDALRNASVPVGYVVGIVVDKFCGGDEDGEDRDVWIAAPSLELRDRVKLSHNNNSKEYNGTEGVFYWSEYSRIWWPFAQDVNSQRDGIV